MLIEPLYIYSVEKVNINNNMYPSCATYKKIIFWLTACYLRPTLICRLLVYLDWEYLLADVQLNRTPIIAFYDL